jgi:hypothetical protein
MRTFVKSSMFNYAISGVYVICFYVDALPRPITM